MKLTPREREIKKNKFESFVYDVILDAILEECDDGTDNAMDSYDEVVVKVEKGKYIYEYDGVKTTYDPKRKMIVIGTKHRINISDFHIYDLYYDKEQLSIEIRKLMYDTYHEHGVWSDEQRFYGCNIQYGNK